MHGAWDGGLRVISLFVGNLACFGVVSVGRMLLCFHLSAHLPDGKRSKSLSVVGSQKFEKLVYEESHY